MDQCWCDDLTTAGASKCVLFHMSAPLVGAKITALRRGGGGPTTSTHTPLLLRRPPVRHAVHHSRAAVNAGFTVMVTIIANNGITPDTAEHQRGTSILHRRFAVRYIRVAAQRVPRQTGSWRLINALLHTARQRSPTIFRTVCDNARCMGLCGCALDWLGEDKRTTRPRASDTMRRFAVGVVGQLR